MTIGMWDMGLDFYNNNLTAGQQAVAQRNGFLRKLPIPSKRDNGVETFYNNFEVVHVTRFLLQDFTSFTETVDATNNIYRHR